VDGDSIFDEANEVGFAHLFSNFINEKTHFASAGFWTFTVVQ